MAAPSIGAATSPALLAGLALALTAAMPAAAGSATTGSATSGRQLYEQRCAMCHATKNGRSSTLGPDLNGVMGRRAASADGFSYSPALKKSGLIWDRASLDRYLTNPGKTVPGTRMMVAVGKPEERDALIDYLTAQ